MPAKPFHLLFFIGFFIHSCIDRPLVPKNNSHALEAKNNLFVFVGKKIRFEELPYEKGSLDNGFKATYKILQRVYGEYAADTITFEAYDHYGIPAFESYENVLLYVVEENGKFYHEKYQFSAVYPTKNKRWAGTYSDDYRYYDSVTVKPEKITFLRPLTFVTSRYFFNGMIFCDEKSFPSPYFRIESDTAFAVYGNYVEQLFQIKKEGILLERGLFGDTLIDYSPVPIQDVIMEEISEPADIQTDKRFISFARLFIKKLAMGDTTFLERYLSDTLSICRRRVYRKDFLQEKRERIWDKRFMEEVIPEGVTSYMTFEIGAYSQYAELKTKAIHPRVMQIHLHSQKGNLIHYSIELNFIETRNGYQLVTMEDQLNRACSGEEYDPYNDFT